MENIFIWLAAALGLYMAWNIGANDVANSMADAVGSRAISIKRAVILAGICEFAGAVLVGSHVTDTVRKGIVSPEAIASTPGIQTGDVAAVFVIGMTAALLAAALWLNYASYKGLPVSTTHSIVGAIAGFGICAAGMHAVNWGKMGQIVASWFISPIAGGILGFFSFKFISKFILQSEEPARSASRYAPFIVFIITAVVTLATLFKGLKHVIKGLDWLTPDIALAITAILSLFAAYVSKSAIGSYLKGKESLPIPDQLNHVERVFTPIVVITSCSVAFAHGANDVANAIGPLAAVVHIVQTGTVDMKIGVPLWVLVLGGSGIVLGLATYGYRVMLTVGTKITEITPSRGVAADIAATATVLVCTRLKLPVSTTHTLVGAIMGIGFARGLGGIDYSVTRKIFTSWLVTVPAAALLSILIFITGVHFYFDTIKMWFK